MTAASTALWRSDEVVRATGGASNAAWRASGVSIDSRSAEPGDLFVAIKGPRVDGHAFVAAALERGAVAAVVTAVPAGCERAPLVVVEDTQAALEALGRAARARANAKVIAVTGSVGKTGTKEALKLVLERQGRTTASAASLNNLWGVPLSLARMPRDAQYGVFELGMNHPGELAPLAALVAPNVAIVTTIAAVHMEFFDTIMDIAEAKAEIFSGMRGGVAVLNRDNPFFPVLIVSAYAAEVERVISFGAHPEAQMRLLAYKPAPTGSDVSAHFEGREIKYRLGVSGRHWAFNSLAVLAAVHAVGADVDQAAAALGELAAPKGRGKRHRVALAGGSFELIDDSYNASPASMRGAIEILANSKPSAAGRRIAALGDMLELGPESARLHAGLESALRAGHIDLVFSAGTFMRALHEALPPEMRGSHAETSEALAKILVEQVRPGDVVTVKGSLGSRMAKVVEALLALHRMPHAVNG
jgi:UDP-N-acetylmuramoyl-tripeptide--D-alanyl-D-alanine ligase